MLFPLQIIVTKNLDQKKHTWLSSLTRSMKHDTARNLLHSCEDLENTTDRKNASVVLDFVSNVNESLFLKILKEDEHMTEAMKILIEPELMNLRLIINNKDAEIADNKAKLANKDAEIADNKAKLADKDAEIADNKAKLADKDAEIAKLKQQLLEVSLHHKES